MANYQNFFGCRWEIKGAPGNQIKVKTLAKVFKY